MGDPWSPPVSQPALLCKLQARERPCLQEQGGQQLRNETQGLPPFSTLMYSQARAPAHTCVD